MADIVTELPLPLLQLVHLHLLEYPLANDPEYDQNLFNPNVRGLRDRIKSMEDVCYFLVAKVEGRKESARTVSPNPQHFNIVLRGLTQLRYYQRIHVWRLQTPPLSVHHSLSTWKMYDMQRSIPNPALLISCRERRARGRRSCQMLMTHGGGKTSLCASRF